MQKLTASVNALAVKVAQAKGVQERINSQCELIKTKIDSCVIEIANKRDAHLLLLAFISQRREAAIESIESTGTHALCAIYDEDLAIHFLRNEEKKNSAAFKMEVGIESNFMGQRIITGVKDCVGGGLIETSSFSLRIAALEWLGYNGPFIIDEAWGKMSADLKIENVAKFLSQYVQSSGRQVIFATHMADIFSDYADHIIRVEKHNGLSKSAYD